MVATESEVIEKVDKPGGLLQSCDENNDSDSQFAILSRVSPDYKLTVRSPLTVSSPSGPYTTYSIFLQSTSAAFRLNKSEIRRRFSDFVWLRKELDKSDNWRSPPSLPSRRFWNLLDPNFIESRRQNLEKWLHSVLSEPEYLSSSALHLFLQTEMPTQDIQNYLNGMISEETIAQIWTNHGRLYNFQPHNLLHNSFHQEPTEIRYTEEDTKTPRSSALPFVSLLEPPSSSPDTLGSNPDTVGETNPEEGAQSQTEQDLKLIRGREQRRSLQATTKPKKSSQEAEEELHHQNRQEELKLKSEEETKLNPNPKRNCQTEQISSAQVHQEIHIHEEVSETSRSGEQKIKPRSEQDLPSQVEQQLNAQIQQEPQVEEELQETDEQRVELSRSRETTPEIKDATEVAIFEFRERPSSPDSGFQEEKSQKAVGIGPARKTEDPSENLKFPVEEAYSVNGD